MYPTLRTRAPILLALALVTGLLTGCTSPSVGGSAQPDPAKPADLTGTWKQSNSTSDDSYQEATITGDTIEVNWVTDDGDTTALYWAGTFIPPTDAGAYTWTSQNDTEKTSGSLLASSDPTKEFAFDGSVISYKVSALGTTTTVELSRE